MSQKHRARENRTEMEGHHEENRQKRDSDEIAGQRLSVVPTESCPARFE
jgi:hypothetical protein